MVCSWDLGLGILEDSCVIPTPYMSGNSDLKHREDGDIRSSKRTQCDRYVTELFLQGAKRKVLRKTWLRNSHLLKTDRTSAVSMGMTSALVALGEHTGPSTLEESLTSSHKVKHSLLQPRHLTGSQKNT